MGGARIGGPWTLAFIILVSSVGGLPTYGADAGSSLTFAGETTLESEGAHYATVHLDEPSEILSWTISTQSENAAFILAGPVTKWVFKSGSDVMPDEFSALSMPRGKYFVYLTASPPSPVSFTLRLEGPVGSTTIALDRPTRHAFSDLAPVLQSEAVARFHGSAPFEGETYTGFFIQQRQLAPDHHHREWRWSNPDGILSCFPSIAGGVSRGYATERIVLFSSWGHRLPLNLTYYRYSAGIVVEESVKGIWIERAPDDASDWMLEPVRPMTWPLVESHAIADQDALCASFLLNRATVEFEHHTDG